MLDFLKEKKNLNLDAPETTILHRNIILRKKFLKKLYVEWYNNFLNILPDLPEGKILEIGSGGGFLKDLNNTIITSDIQALPNCDLTFNAEKMPFDDNSLSAIFMINVLHHIPNTEQFLKEAQRTLKKDGILFMSEPANTWFSRLIYKNVHIEPFNTDVKKWNFPSSGPLSGANGALPWIIFERDRNIFIENFKNLKILEMKLHTPFRYLLSGGLSYKTPFPGWSFKAVTFFEKLWKPFYRYFAMFQIIKVVKK